VDRIYVKIRQACGRNAAGWGLVPFFNCKKLIIYIIIDF
jgi:hypothetical protein